MKKLFLAAIIVVAMGTGAFAQSQNYKAFKVDLGFLYGMAPGSDLYGGGAGFYFEPKYNVTDNIAAGLRIEFAVMGAADALGENVSVSALGSYLATGDYYVGTEGVRPYGGLGLGVYNVGQASLDNGTDVGVEAGTKFGFAPRVGILLGHFRTGLEYNLVTGIEGANYLSWKLGFEIGGGRK